MSEVRLVICDASRAICADRHGNFADAAVAALSAEPETIEELEAAMGRFIVRGERGFFEGFWAFHAGGDDKPHDAGLVIIDLAARLVAQESTFTDLLREGWVPWHDGEKSTDIEAGYHLSDDWELREQIEGWQALAASRRRERAANPPLDVRAVLYSEPLVEFIARECLSVFRGCPVEARVNESAPAGGDEDDRESDYARVRQVHVSWMMTARDDLRGLTPREAMVARRGFVDRCLQDRADLWSRTDRCPRGIDPASRAYRFGGFGTHELVTYYEMVRLLIRSCRVAVGELSLPEGDKVRDSELLSGEVRRLAELREEWLDEPDPEFSGRTPRSIIHNERVHIPEGGSGHEAMVDHDCPLCRELAEMPGPMFWHLDGCNMDDDFAFSFYHRTLVEWQEQRRKDEEFNRRFDAEQAEEKRLGAENPAGGYADPDDAWEQSFSVEMEPGQPAVVRLFAVGAHLAELIVRLKEPPDERPLIDRLNRDFGNLREVSQSPDANGASALLVPVVERFCVTLEEVAAARKELEPKCTDLAARLRKFGDPVDQDIEPPSLDEDVPF